MTGRRTALVDAALVAQLLGTMVTVVIIEILGTFLLSRRSPRGRQLPSGAVVLEYGRGVRSFSGGLSAFALGLVGFLAAVEPIRTSSDVLYVLLTLGLFTALVAGLLIEVYRVGYRVDASGIEKRSPWSSSFFLPWNEVQRIQYSANLRGYVLKSWRGKVRVSQYLDGYEEFVRLAR